MIEKAFVDWVIATMVKYPVASSMVSLVTGFATNYVLFYKGWISIPSITRKIARTDLINEQATKTIKDLQEQLTNLEQIVKRYRSQEALRVLEDKQTIAELRERLDSVMEKIGDQ